VDHAARSESDLPRLRDGKFAGAGGNLLVIVNDNEKQQYIAAFDKKQASRSGARIGNRRPRGSGQDGRRHLFGARAAHRDRGGGTGRGVSYDLAGKELWRMSGMAGRRFPRLSLTKACCISTAGEDALLFALRPGAAGDISLEKDQTSNEYVVWSQPRAGTYLPSPVAYEGAVYALTETGILSRFDAKTGKQTYKTRIDPAATAFTTSPWAYNGKLFCLSEEGQTFVIATGEKFQVIARE
jgi:outer membrane protein assembly factor BamB